MDEVSRTGRAGILQGVPAPNQGKLTDIILVLAQNFDNDIPDEDCEGPVQIKA